MLTLDSAVSLLRLLVIDIPWLNFYLFHTNLARMFRCFFPKPLKSLKAEIILVREQVPGSIIFLDLQTSPVDHITGSANGLGRELCLALANSGATTLVCWDVDKRKNEELVRQIRETGTHAYSYILDISNPASIKANADRVKSEVGHVSMIINNAGVFSLKQVQEYMPEEVENMFKINVMSHFWILREFLPKMIERKRGHVTAIASAACHMTMGLMTSYTSTKHAIHGLMESLRDEIFRREGEGAIDIKLTTVYPRVMQTNMSSPYKFNFRFASLSKMLDPASCAKSIVEGIRRDYEYIQIPYLQGTIDKYIISMIPSKVMSALYSILGVTHRSVVDQNNGRATNDELNRQVLK